MDKIEKIRAEIERRLNILTNVYAEQVERKDEEMMNYYHGKVIALEELRPFLDTLSAEPDKSLEEAAEEHSFTHHETNESLEEAVTRQMEDDGDVDDFIRKGLDETVLKYAQIGAEWQASQMPMLEDTVLFNKGVAEGRRLEREDMMKDAIPFYEILKAVPSLERENTRIIIIKEEE